MKTKTNLFLFYTAFGLFYAGVIFEHTALYNSMNIKYACYCLACMFLAHCCIVHSRFGVTRTRSIKQYIALIITVVIFLLIIKTHDVYLFFIFLYGRIACEFDDKEINKLIKIAMYICCGFVIIIPILCICGLIPNLNSIRGIGESSRLAYGFNHSQVLPIISVYIVFMMYTIRKKVTLLNFGAVQLISIIIYMIFDSRNAILSIELFYLVYIFCCLITHKSKKRKKIIPILGKCSVYVAAIFSFVFLELYRNHNSLAIVIDDILSHRFREPLHYFTNGYMEYLKFRSYDEFYSLQLAVNKNLDNTYFYLAIRYGFVFLLLFGLFYNLLFDFYKRQNNLLAYEVLLTVSFSIMITNSLTSYFLPFLIIASREMWLITKSKINVLKL